MMDRQLNKGSRKGRERFAFRCPVIHTAERFFFCRFMQDTCAYRASAVDCSFRFIRHTGARGILLPTDVEAGKAC